MDRYEYNLKTEQLKKYASEGFFDEDALEICDSINWKREKDMEILTIGAKVYEQYRRYERTLFILERIYRFSNARRRNAYHIIEVALEYGDYNTAENYLDEYKRLASGDSKSILLEYRIAKGRIYARLDNEQEHAKNWEIQQLNQIIPILERYVEEDCDEASMYELAEQYHRVGRIDDCIHMCDQISIWFSVGQYVEKALKLKTLYMPLSEEQREMITNRDKYEERLKEFVSDLKTSEEIPELVTKEEAKERAEKKVDAIEEKPLAKEDVIVMTNLKTLEEEQKEEAKEEKNEEKNEEKSEEPKEKKPKNEKVKKSAKTDFARSAKNIQHRAEKISIGSLEQVRKLKEEFLQQEQEEAQNVVEEVVATQQAEEAPEVEEKQTTAEEVVVPMGHFVIKSDIEKKGIQLAISIISEKTKQQDATSQQVAYVSGEQLNQLGVMEALAELSNVVLLIKKAGSLSESSLWNLNLFMEKEDNTIVIVFIDTADGIEGIWKKNWKLKEQFQYHYSVNAMSVDDLAEYAIAYAASKECVLHDMAFIPLYDTLEIIVSDKKGNEKRRVEDLIDFAIENAAGRTLRQRMRNMFLVRLDEQGHVILHEKDFV